MNIEDNTGKEKARVEHVDVGTVIQRKDDLFIVVNPEKREAINLQTQGKTVFHEDLKVDVIKPNKLKLVIE